MPIDIVISVSAYRAGPYVYFARIVFNLCLQCHHIACDKTVDYAYHAMHTGNAQYDRQLDVTLQNICWQQAEISRLK